MPLSAIKVARTKQHIKHILDELNVFDQLNAPMLNMQQINSNLFFTDILAYYHVRKLAKQLSNFSLGCSSKVPIGNYYESTKVDLSTLIPIVFFLLVCSEYTGFLMVLFAKRGGKFPLVGTI